MNKHAYCIIAHTDQYLLETLLKSLDDERNDLYILLDKKSDIDTSRLKRCNYKSGVQLLDKQINIHWGGGISGKIGTLLV